MIRLSEHLHVVPGPVHTGVLTDGSGRSLLIDPGAADLRQALDGLGGSDVAAILLTHHHPAQHAALRAVRGPHTRVLVPAAERDLLTDPHQAFWSAAPQRWHVYHMRPHAPVPARGVSPDGTLAPGDVLPFGPARLTAIATPGHTDGSLSYLVEVDGRRVAFVGDLVAGPGCIPDVPALQQGEAGLRDYHGFLGAHERLLAGVRAVLALTPDTLVCSMGGAIDPGAGDLAGRLRAAYAAYLAGSAGRFYFPQLFARRQDIRWMADAPVADPPPHVLHTGTTYVLVAGNGEALVLDCGAPRVVERLRQWQREGVIGAVAALWISHFHDDHVDAVPDFLAAFPGCPVFADERVSEVLARPEAYRLPCQSPHPVSVTRPLADGETWTWRDFTLTSRWFPGQTIHHAALLAVGRGHRVFFIGDSFTPTGMDDYCAYNRNLLREDGGYARCLRLVREHNPALLLNCHVDAGFRLEEAQLGFLERNLAERRRLFGALLPWPDPDFGLDPEWARAYPYQQRARAGGGVRLQLHIDNHSREPLRFAGVPQPPPGWRATSPVGAVTVGGHGEGVLPFELGVPPETASGRYVVPITVRMGERDLGPITEAVVDVVGGP